MLSWLFRMASRLIGRILFRSIVSYAAPDVVKWVLRRATVFLSEVFQGFTAWIDDRLSRLGRAVNRLFSRLFGGSRLLPA
jgi:hypothetical protein